VSLLFLVCLQNTLKTNGDCCGGRELEGCVLHHKENGGAAFRYLHQHHRQVNRPRTKRYGRHEENGGAAFRYLHQRRQVNRRKQLNGGAAFHSVDGGTHCTQHLQMNYSPPGCDQGKEEGHHGLRIDVHTWRST
jgi:hypothetical protein